MLDVRREAFDDIMSLTITPRLGEVSDNLRWIGDSLPVWRRSYGAGGEPRGGSRTPDDPLFDRATGQLFTVSYLVLSLPPNLDLETGGSWERTDRHPQGRVTNSFELLEVTDEFVRLQSSASFVPFDADDASSWKETVEGTYDRRDLMAVDLRVRHDRQLAGSVERSGASVPITAATTLDKSIRRSSK